MDFVGLTDAQANFIKKYFKSVGLINRGKSKEYNQGLVDEYRAFQDRCTQLRKLAGTFDDKTISSRLMTAIDAADKIVGRNQKAPDISGGHAQLDTVENVMELRMISNQWAKSLPEYQRKVADAQGRLPMKKVELGTLLSAAEQSGAQAATAQSAAGFKLALKTLGKIDVVIQEGDSEIDLMKQAKSGKVEHFEKAAALATAKPLFENEKTRFEQIKASHAATFKPTLPPTIVAQNAVIEKIISDTDQTDPEALKTAVEALKREIPKLEEIAKAPIAGLAKWTAAIAPVTQRQKTLENHPLVGDGVIVPLVDAVRNDINSATGLKGNHQYDEALRGLEGLVDKISSAIKAADDKSHYDAIHADRKQRADTLPASGTVANALVKAEIKAVEDKMTAAASAISETPPDYTKALKSLEDVAEKVTNATRWQRFVTEVENAISLAETKVKNWSKDANVAKAMKSELDRYAALAAAQKELVKTDVEAAKANTGGFWMLETAFQAKFKHATAYFKEKAEFRKRFFEIEEHDGRRAVEEYYTRLKADGALSDTRFEAGDLHLAGALLKGSEKIHPEMKAQAELGKAYFPIEKEVDEGLKELGGKANKDTAAGMIAEINVLRSEAVNAGLQRRDWTTAMALINEAKKAARGGQGPDRRRPGRH